MHKQLPTYTILFLLLFFCRVEATAYNITVDRNGRGDYRNIQDAINAIPALNTQETVRIFIHAGTYKEKITIPAEISGLQLIGEDAQNTIITYDDHANINGMGTFNTYTLLIKGNNIHLENLSIENSSLQLGQAVALHTEGDRIIIRNCRLLGHQDTFFTGGENARIYIENSYIEGTTDFIFGPATAWFEKCRIHCLKNSYITAASTPQDIPYGYIFNRCTVTLREGIDRVTLGRPWRPYAMTLFMNSYLPEGINKTGWHNWGREDNEKTARYMEYNNTGAGAYIEERVQWSKQLTPEEAILYTVKEVMKGKDGWNPQTVIQKWVCETYGQKNYVKMADSEMLRNPEAWMIDFSKAPKWNYCHGLEMMSILQVWQKTGAEKYYDYVYQYADLMIDPEGNIQTYNPAEYNIDRVNTGRILFPLLDREKEERFEKALHLIRSQMDTHPRTAEGSFWHKKVYPHQVWLDGLYMACPFLAGYAQRFNEPTLFDDIALQITDVHKHMHDPVTGLYYHGWDEKRQQKWADPVTGLSPNFWSRSIGWYMMAIVDVLDYMPANHPRRSEIITILQNLARSVEQFRDPQTGMWYQVTNQLNRTGNYLEATGSIMFIYSWVKGAQKGYLNPAYLEKGEQAYQQFLNRFIKINPEGNMSVTNCCAVAGLGDTRNGTFEYYISEPIRENDPKAIGPFIMVSLMLNQ